MKINSAIGTMPREYDRDKSVVLSGIKRVLYDMGLGAAPVKVANPHGNGRAVCVKVTGSSALFETSNPDGSSTIQWRLLERLPLHMLSKIHVALVEERNKTMKR